MLCRESVANNQAITRAVKEKSLGNTGLDLDIQKSKTGIVVLTLNAVL